jgi:tRNA U34 5-methylaminomethyl-2-thiouridine-forming methyltransferase MnmC
VPAFNVFVNKLVNLAIFDLHSSNLFCKVPFEKKKRNYHPINMKIEIVKTLDGSNTLFLEEFGEHYHSTFGAIQESLHIFIQEGFNQIKSKEINIFEIGFGTGLNCYLTLLANLKCNHHVRYYSVEKFPLPESVWEKLNYTEQFPDTNSSFFPLIHKAPWNSPTAIQKEFILHKMDSDLLETNYSSLPPLDLVYFDAFSPEKQPELWDQSVFQSLFAMMRENSILVTYCAKGSIRRMLQSIGFGVERIAGPPGKREMLRASKIVQS